MIRFRYQSQPLKGPAPPSLALGATFRLRPMVSVRIVGPGGRLRDFRRCVVDSGADDTIFPWDAAALIGASLLADFGHVIRWRGTSYSLRYGRVSLQLSADGMLLQWPAIVGFSSAPIAYPLLGVAGFLEFFDATLRGADHVVELEPNRSFPGTIP